MAALTNAQRQRRWRECHQSGDLFPPLGGEDRAHEPSLYAPRAGCSGGLSGAVEGRAGAHRVGALGGDVLVTRHLFPTGGKNSPL